MEQTRSYERVFPASLRARYEFAEVRNAAATLAGTNPAEFAHVVEVLTSFKLTLAGLTDAGGSKGVIARELDLAFRKLGWREVSHRTETELTLRREPYRPAGETTAQEKKLKFVSEGHKVDNVLGRVALDVEWSAKDGNLDRDLANFRALHEAAVIDCGIIITRDQERTKYAANTLAELAGRIRYDQRTGKRIVLLGTTTTTNLEKLVPRLERGDGGGCPVLVVAFTDLGYEAQSGEPTLPPYRGPITLAGVPAEAEE